jgi:hypothetical protein
MPAEIQISAALSATRKGVNIAPSANGLADMNGDPMIENVQIIGTGTEAIVLGDVANPAYLFLQNLDDTNVIDVSTDNGNANKLTSLKPGQFALFPPVVLPLYATAHTAPSNLLVAAA